MLRPSLPNQNVLEIHLQLLLRFSFLTRMAIQFHSPPRPTALELAHQLNAWVHELLENRDSSWHTLYWPSTLRGQLLSIPPTPLPCATDARGYTACQHFDLLSECVQLTCARLGPLALHPLPNRPMALKTIVDSMIVPTHAS
jgi:hypothetical protein